MITQKQIRALQDIKGMDWITALRPDAIRKLIEGEAIQMGARRQLPLCGDDN